MTQLQRRIIALVAAFAMTPASTGLALDKAADIKDSTQGTVTSDSKQAGDTETTPTESEELVRLLVEKGIPEAQAEGVVAQLTPEDISVLVENPEMLEEAGAASEGGAVAAALLVLLLLFLLIYFAAKGGAASA